MSSSITKAPPNSSNDVISPEEESGWTTYFDDFFNNHVHNNKCSMSLSGIIAGSSLVSDAASLVEKKVEFSEKKNVIRSSVKKRKDVITALIDDALEDTATSPLNSPKEKGITTGQRDEQKELSFNIGRDSDGTGLKKRGLCLLPMSMVANYVNFATFGNTLRSKRSLL